MFYPVTELEKQMFLYGMKGLVKSAYIYGTDKNGAIIEILNDDLRMGTFAIDRYCCNGEKLEVGTAIASQLSFTLDNSDGRYNNIVFEGTELTVEIIISAPTAGVHYLSMGLFTPDEQPRRLNTIKITALDRMTKFDAVVDATQLTFPATVAGLVGQVCGICGVTLAESISGLPNASLSIAALPESSAEITYRNLIQWCAGLMATNAWIDWLGKLRFNWYNNIVETVIDADIRFDGDVYEDDLTITGVMYTNNSGATIVYGTDDYAIDLTGNLLLGPVIATALPIIANAVQGFTYRPCEASTLPLPYLWPMDSIAYKVGGVTHASTLTNVAFGINGGGTLAAQGMTYAMNQRKQGNPLTKDQAQLVNEVAYSVEVLDESLTQQEIFNRLTDGGQNQGIYLQDGKVYVNATYIMTGILNGKLIQVMGDSSEAHAEIDFNSMVFYDRVGNQFFLVGDARNQSGNATVTDTFIADGSTRIFSTSSSPSSIVSVTVDGTAATYTQNVNLITLSTTPTQGQMVEIEYVTTSPVYYYTLGRRASGENYGNYSVGEGAEIVASGQYSHAEGGATEARGDGSHAEGRSTRAYGRQSHAEGYNSEASGGYSHTEGFQTEAAGVGSHAEGYNSKANGDYSHAEGNNTIASGTAQRVFGRYNVEDSNDTYAEIVGNGTSDSNRANARTLDWYGNETIAGRLTISLSSTAEQSRIIFISPGVSGQMVLVANTTGQQQRMTFRQYTSDGSHYEEYALPNTAGYTGGDVLRNILTDKSPVTISQGGTNATTAAVTITNDYSSVANVIDAVKDIRIFPISVQKHDSARYNDMPSGYETQEWNMLLVGDSTRMTVHLYIYRADQPPKLFLRNYHATQGWLQGWVQVQTA